MLLTEAEAEQVATALRARLDGGPGYAGPGYHLHLNDGRSEFTMGVLDSE